MAIKIETNDPGVSGVRKAVERYKKIYPDFGESIELYGSVMEVQQSALSGIECAAALSSINVESRLKEGEPLLDPADVEIPPDKFRHIVGEICAAIEEKDAGGPLSREKLLAWEGLGDKNSQETRERILSGERLNVEDFQEGNEEEDVTAEVLWEGLVPFYRKCGSVLQNKIDHALWQRGYCPVCGTGPLMGKLRREDGLWLLECRLCHTLWNVQRAKCPFCSRREGGSLEYLYLGNDSSHRVQYCSRCKRFVKTVDLRAKQGEALLPLENIVTELLGLNLAAEQEGLQPA